MIVWFPTSLGQRGEILEGMVTFELLPNYIHNEYWGWIEIQVGHRYWSRDRWAQGKMEFFTNNPEGMEKAKKRCEAILETMAGWIAGRVGKAIT